MATYKVIQDIEAEDKLLGPLSLRQFIYAAIVVVSGFIAFKLAIVAWWAAIPFVPHMILFGLLAAPFGRDQSSEVWLLAKIRFWLKPQRRIWDQSGLKELVTITVPKRIERQLTDGLSQTEVKSRLEALANTIDSRGWAVKNVNVNLFSQPSYVSAYAGNSDRLVDPSTLPQEVPNYDTQAVNDIMDTQTSPTAQHFDQLITATEQQRRQQAVAKMQQAAQPSTSTQPADYWFMNQTPQPTEPGTAAFDTPAVVTPGSDQPTPVPVAPPQVSAADEQKLLDKIHKKRKQPDPMNSHLKRIKPLAEQHDEAKKKASETASAPVTPPSKPAILELANNDDLNISTIARQANKANKQGPPDDEVVISLR